MSSGASGPIRRSQLISPFGPGAMVVVSSGTALVTCGIDHWYEREDRQGKTDLQEYHVEEWRLQNLLRVSHFRMPPDYRRPWVQTTGPNIGLTVPFLRFPQWHFCPSPTCRLLMEQPLSVRGRIRCPDCEAKNKRSFMYQVAFVALCDQGHLQDFPWREWVHKSIQPACQQPLRLVATGSASLTGQQVECDCGKRRNLARITTANSEKGTTELSTQLQEGAEFLCQGHRPWLGDGAEESCTRPLRGSLRNASNVYYAQVRSAIYLPRVRDARLQELLTRLEAPPLSSLLNLLSSFKTEATPAILRVQQARLLQDYSDEDIIAALSTLQPSQVSAVTDELDGEEIGDDKETAFRRAEFNVLRTAREESLLRITPTDLSTYEPDIARYFSRLMLVDKLRETRALTGFTRIFPENKQTLEERQAMLWRAPPDTDTWLPAYTVFGEGIFIEFAENELQAWECQPDVIERAQLLADRYAKIQQNRGLLDRFIGPRFILLHTFAHLIMNRLTFECGYSSAALRERLYVSVNPTAPMAGVLIYTADGDAEGTLGGLVRMGKPGYLEPVVRRALEGAQWCSADPVCMEMGNQGGQGPDSCNLAACHNCALVPETACEEFNRFLDRAAIIGDITTNPDIGYFRREGN